MMPALVAVICALLPTCVLPEYPVDEPTWPAAPEDRLSWVLGHKCTHFLIPQEAAVQRGIDDLWDACQDRHASAAIDVIDATIPLVYKAPRVWTSEPTLERLVKDRRAWEQRRVERISDVTESLRVWVSEWHRLHLMHDSRPPRARAARARRDDALAFSPWPNDVTADVEMLPPPPRRPVHFYTNRHKRRRALSDTGALVMPHPEQTPMTPVR